MKQLKKYPLVALFFVFLALFSLVDTVKPAKARSEYENRPLAQAPAFDPASFFGNAWTRDYGEYVRDQFLGRDGWVGLQSVLETAQGKLESNGIWLAADGYQIARNDTFSPEQQTLLARNTEAVAAFAARHEGQVTAMVVPSPANVLRDLLRANPPQVDEDAYLDATFAAWQAAGAGVVDLRAAYADAHAEGVQLYYRTDHHWTTEGGARLAYEAFCAATGQAAAVPTAPQVRVEDFYGTSYAKTREPGTRPDTLVYYDYENLLTVYAYQADGSLAAEPGPLMLAEKLAEYDKYGAFLRGNNGYSVLEGNGTGRILVVKDSYGNCLAPYLIENYAQIGIVDLRTWPTSVDELMASEGYDQVLVLYCFDSFTTDTNLYRLGSE